ncbi:MAG TPA: hypothetical protein VLK82_14595 [Candidatus Tectomicrobia bacterium]|nr:hypothetical protein [Candidatus Tectomicrobia bacterium]
MVSFRTVAVFIAVVGLIFGLAGLADAAHTKAHKASRAEDREMRGGPGKPEMILQGPVLAVSPGTGFIVMRHGAGRDAEEIPIEIDSKTSLMRGGKRVSIDEVTVGDRVKVSYSGQMGDVSKMVEVMAGPTTRARKRT